MGSPGEESSQDAPSPSHIDRASGPSLSQVPETRRTGRRGNGTGAAASPVPGGPPAERALQAAAYRGAAPAVPAQAQGTLTEPRSHRAAGRRTAAAGPTPVPPQAVSPDPVAAPAPTPAPLPPPVLVTTPMPGIWEWDSSAHVHDLLMQEASIWADLANRAVEPAAVGGGTWSPIVPDWHPDTEPSAREPSPEENLAAILGLLGAQEASEEDAVRQAAPGQAGPSLLPPVQPGLRAEAAHEVRVGVGEPSWAARGARPHPPQLLRTGRGSATAAETNNTLPLRRGRAHMPSLATGIQAGPAAGQALAQAPTQLIPPSVSAVLELAGVGAADEGGLARAPSAQEPSLVPQLTPGASHKKRDLSAIAVDTGAQPRVRQVHGTGALLGSISGATASDARFRSADAASLSPGSASGPASGPGSAFGPASASGSGSASGTASASGPGPSRTPASGKGRGTATAPRGKRKKGQTLELASQGGAGAEGGASEPAAGAPGPTSRRASASATRTTAGWGQRGGSAEGSREESSLAEEVPAAAGTGQRGPRQEQPQQQQQQQRVQRARGQRGAAQARPGGGAEETGSRGGLLVAKLVMQAGDGPEYSKEADGMSWWKNATKQVVRRSDTSEAVKRSYYKCVQCQQGEFEGPERAKKVPEPVLGFPSVFLVRYYGDHSPALHIQREVLESVLWENSCAAQGGSWADLWSLAHATAVQDALVAATGCTEGAALQGATQVGKCLMGRSNR